MDDDLGVPQALAVLHDTVREGNAALAAGDDATRSAARSVRRARDARRARRRPARRAVGERGRRRRTELHGVVDALVAGSRSSSAPTARARKDFAAADAIRDQLAGRRRRARGHRRRHRAGR